MMEKIKITVGAITLAALAYVFLWIMLALGQAYEIGVIE